MSSGNATNGWLLVVDDEPALTNLLKLFLERAGYRVETNTDPQSGLVVFAQQPERFAALIVDLALPGMTGEDFVLEARKLRPGLPAIITSGYPHQTKLPSARFLQKPFAPKCLGEVLEQLLAG